MKNRIRELRRAKGITMKQLGTILDLAESTISHYETGKRQLDNETLLRLSEFFGVTVGYILGAENSAPANVGKCAVGDDINLSKAELDLIQKFRHLDQRGQSAVLNLLEHEYSALSTTLRVAARDGSYQEVQVTGRQQAALKDKLSSLPDVPEDL